MKIQESGENYLEAIWVLSQRNGNVRSIDVASFLGFTKPSVSRAMTILKNAGHITMERNGLLHLTESGQAIANSVYERHQLLSKFLIRIGVSEDTAAQDACRLEHVISEESFEKLKEFSKGYLQ